MTLTFPFYLDLFYSSPGTDGGRRPSTLAVTEGRRKSSLGAMDHLTNAHAGNITVTIVKEKWSIFDAVIKFSF